ncbi:MAG TPA: arsenate reductase ArsC [Phototrophicaceae bacterium]|nr:arsenate reductase ArsC [Phototrophicaceae bacterium]
MDKIRVLFLCTGNSARSQMAEGLLRARAGDRFDVYSAGLDPKGVNPYAVRAMDKIGIDIRRQRSKSIKEYMGREFFPYVITLCSDADERCPQAIWAWGSKKLHWPFDDPAQAIGTDDQILAKFEQVRDQIAAQIELWLEERATQEAQA